tara:strand:- start:310 stop:831 length:522 start_codon:yes stop_codon:yes gene_type:complete
MAATHEHIATATASSSPSFLEVTSIPATYQDLEVIIQSKTDQTSYGASSGKITFNGVTSSDYSLTKIRKNGTSMYASVSSSQAEFDINYAHGPGNQSEMSGYVRLYIPEYASSVAHAVNLWATSWDTTTAGEVSYTAGMFRPSSSQAISSIKWTTVYTIEDDCTMSVYGINYA